MIIFSRNNSNYDQQNMRDMLLTTRDPVINEIINHPRDTITVVGDIHRSQMILSNVNNLFWFKITATQNGQDVLYLRSFHFYVCFRPYFGNIPAKYCVNPPEYRGIADVTGYYGVWELVTYGNI